MLRRGPSKLPFERRAAFWESVLLQRGQTGLTFLIGYQMKMVRCAAQVSLDAEAPSPNLGPTDSSQLIKAATAGRGFHGGVTIKYLDI